MYETDSAAVTEALQTSDNPAFTQTTIDLILSLTTGGGNSTVSFGNELPDASGNVTVAAGTEVVFINSSDTTPTVIVPPNNVPVVIFQGSGGVFATFNDGSGAGTVTGGTARVIVGSAGPDQIIIGDQTPSFITIGGGDTVVAGGGDSTIVAGLGSSTIIGGTGHSIVQLGGTSDNFHVAVGGFSPGSSIANGSIAATPSQATTTNGRAIITNSVTGITTDVSGIQFVQLDGGAALIFAKDSNEAAIATLYHTVFGRDADAGGLQYWFDQANAGASLAQLANTFVYIADTNPATSVANLTNEAFVQMLYQNTFARTGDVNGINYWLNSLQDGATRADLVETFASIAANVIDGSFQTDIQVVGSVTIIPNIV